MPKLFQVCTANYKTYYVIANTYDHAAAKTLKYIEEEEGLSVISDDGSLKMNLEEEKIREVRILTENIIK